MSDDSAHDYASYVEIDPKAVLDGCRSVFAKPFKNKRMNEEVAEMQRLANASNPSGILPTGYKVLVKSEEGATAKELKRIGLEIADQTKERDDAASITGTLIAVSPLAFSYHEDWPSEDAKPQVGQRVVYGKYSGTTLAGKDGEEYRLLNDQDLLAVLEF